MSRSEIRAATRRRTRTLVIDEDRCVVCGAWTVRDGSRPRVTCGASHKRTLARMRVRGQTPPYAVDA